LKPPNFEIKGAVQLSTVERRKPCCGKKTGAANARKPNYYYNSFKKNGKTL